MKKKNSIGVFFKAIRRFDRRSGKLLFSLHANGTLGSFLGSSISVYLFSRDSATAALFFVFFPLRFVFGSSRPVNCLETTLNLW